MFGLHVRDVLLTIAWIVFLASFGPMLISTPSTVSVLLGFGVFGVLAQLTYSRVRGAILAAKAKAKQILILLLVLVLAACSKVPAGHVGVKFYLLGGSKGVDTEQLSPGRYWIGWNEELYLFPTFTQNYTWTKGPTDESISFQTREGLTVNADVGISYSIVPAKVPLIFQKYRKGINEITDLFLRNMVRDALVKAASARSIESVYGTGKSELMAETEDAVRAQVESIGINIERIYWAGELRLPPTVVNSINAKIQATQMAEQRRNEVEQAKAEAEKVRATAQGDADARLVIAKAEAESIRIKAEALRSNPEVVQLNAVEKWNGVMPTHVLSEKSVPFISVTPSK